MPVLYYVYEGLKTVEKRSRLRMPIDIRIHKNPSLDAKLIGEVSNVEELLMFVADYRWAKGVNYFIRETEEVNPEIRAKLMHTLYSKTDRRAGEAPVAPDSLGKRRPRKYKTYLPPKYLASKICAKK